MEPLGRLGRLERARRPSANVKKAIFTAMALLLGASTALAQQTMNFRPLPPESVSRIADGTPPAPVVVVHTPGKHGKSGLDIRIDSTGAMVNLPGAGASVPATPAPPDERSDSNTRETTGEIVRFGSDITIPSGQVVEGDVVSMGGSVSVHGTVRGSVTSMGGDVTLHPASRVDGDVVCLGGTLREEPGSSVGGQHVTAPRMPGSRFLLPMLSVVGTSVRVVNHLIRMLLLLLIAFVIVKLAPGRTQSAVDGIRRSAGGAFVVGLLMWGLLVPSLIVVVIGAALLMITLIGIPVGIALLVGYALLLALLGIWGAIVGYALLGEQLQTRLRGGQVDLVRSAMWGVVAVYGLRIVGDLMHVVPVFGFFGGFLNVIAIVTGIVLATLGAGALVRDEYGRRTVQDWWINNRPGRTPRRAAEGFPPPPDPMAPPPPASEAPMPPMPPAPAAPPAYPPPPVG